VVGANITYRSTTWRKDPPGSKGSLTVHQEPENEQGKGGSYWQHLTGTPQKKSEMGPASHGVKTRQKNTVTAVKYTKLAIGNQEPTHTTHWGRGPKKKSEREKGLPKVSG